MRYHSSCRPERRPLTATNIAPCCNGQAPSSLCIKRLVRVGCSEESSQIRPSVDSHHPSTLWSRYKPLIPRHSFYGSKLQKTRLTSLPAVTVGLRLPYSNFFRLAALRWFSLDKSVHRFTPTIGSLMRDWSAAPRHCVYELLNCCHYSTVKNCRQLQIFTKNYSLYRFKVLHF